MNFTNQKKSFTQQKVYIQLNNITTYSQNDIKPKIDEKIKKIDETIKTDKIKKIIQDKEFIKIDENFKAKKDEPEQKVLLNPTIENKTIKTEKKIQNKQIKEMNLTKQYIDKNKKLIAQLLKDNLFYPRSARKRGITGEIIVKFVITKDALVHSLEILSSQNKILSRGALKTIKSLSGKFPAPKEEITLIVPINYSLN